jgi:hypothetical protein
MPPEGRVHWILNCKHCGAPMWLLAEKIRPLFEYPGALANEFHAIAVADTGCKRVETYTLHTDLPGYNPKDGPILVEPDYGDVEHLGPLQCEEESCGILLELFAVWSPATSVRGYLYLLAERASRRCRRTGASKRACETLCGQTPCVAETSSKAGVALHSNRIFRTFGAASNIKLRTNPSQSTTWTPFREKRKSVIPQVVQIIEIRRLLLFNSTESAEDP